MKCAELVHAKSGVVGQEWLPLATAKPKIHLRRTGWHQN